MKLSNSSQLITIVSMVCGFLVASSMVAAGTLDTNLNERTQRVPPGAFVDSLGKRAANHFVTHGVFVDSMGKRAVHQFAPHGSFVDSLGKRPVSQFAPHGVFVDSMGKRAVRHFAPHGAFVDSLGKRSSQQFVHSSQNTPFLSRNAQYPMGLLSLRESGYDESSSLHNFEH